MINTPQSDRVHIAILGKCNSGKSSLINAITGQYTAVVSDTPGTTTDPVSKSMELPGIGASLFIDTAGFDDLGVLGKERLEQTKRVIDKVDIAVMVFFDDDITEEVRWINDLTDKGIPVLPVLNKKEQTTDAELLVRKITEQTTTPPVVVNAKTGEGVGELIVALGKVDREHKKVSITGNLATEEDIVMLVMPQDIQAPQGRLILPQSQTIRDLLDKQCIVVSCTVEQITNTIAALVSPPKLVITDSQVLPLVNKQIPPESKLTTFSVLFAHYKGDIDAFMEGAKAIGQLTEHARVLIAEACTHAPANEDIGRVKIPRMLRGRVGEGLRIDVVSGSDFPSDLAPYDLIIHCGACMFNRRHVLSRIAQATSQKVPITNYGIVIAYLTGILDRVVIPTTYLA